MSKSGANGKRHLQAWEYEAELRRSAVPPPLATEQAADATADDGWGKMHEIAAYRREYLFALWDGRVPGSRAPERLNLEMVQAWGNRGYDVSHAEELLPSALAARQREDWGALEVYTAQIKQRLRAAPRAVDHQYWQYQRPDDWETISSLSPCLSEQAPTASMSPASMPAASITAPAPDRAVADHPAPAPVAPDRAALRRQVDGAWWGQLAAASWGTALEGYSGAALEKHFGERLRGYVITPPDTYNDDIVYELAFLTAYEARGRELTSTDIALQWLAQIPHGWSAEQCALENLRQGYEPPLSASRDNPFSEWIGGQMRGMVCGLVSPNDPVTAAYLAWLDGRVSHQANGIYGEMYAAVAVSLAFHIPDPQRVLQLTADYLPARTWFHQLYSECLAECRTTAKYQQVWANWATKLQRFNWIHTFPNMIATVLALWYGEANFDKSLQILAHCGLDIDCNGGLIGSVLGATTHPPTEWCTPISSGIDTYLPALPHLEISALTDWTMRLIEQHSQS